MSAYGEIRRLQDTELLPVTVWATEPELEAMQRYSVYHLTLPTARLLPGLLEYLCAAFAKEVEDGMTYPQEGEITQTAFETYFFSADVFVGIFGDTTLSDEELPNHSIEAQKGKRSWEDCIGGFYYIKPNYPGRSSHICNAGFLVPPNHRGKGFGISLAKSFLHYAPRLGYQASVFNLVYVNNDVSVKIWEKLGFTKAGLIPRAGRVRSKNGIGEEYVDAWVFYKSFTNA